MDKSDRTKENPFIRINKENGQLFLNKIKLLFKNETLLNKKFNTIVENNFILFPLNDDKKRINKLITSIEGDIDYQIFYKKGVLKKNYKFKTIQEALEFQIPEVYFKFVPKSYDIIGNIAIIEFDKDLASNIKDSFNFKVMVAKGLIQVNKNVKSVFEKKSEIKGSYRLRELKFLFGENRTRTRHRENNCMFDVDIKTTFFTPRLVFERKRIASSGILTNELIVDLFAGVGPFSIQIAKLNKVKIISFDFNPNAYHLLLSNIKLNNLKGTIAPYNIDVKALIEPSNELGLSLKNNVDRIIMNLPENSLEYLNVGCFLLKKSKGIIHNYQFCEKPDPIKRAINNLEKGLEKLNYRIDKVLNSKIVKQFSPKSELVVIDLIVNEI